MLPSSFLKLWIARPQLALRKSLLEFCMLEVCSVNLLTLDVQFLLSLLNLSLKGFQSVFGFLLCFQLERVGVA